MAEKKTIAAKSGKEYGKTSAEMEGKGLGKKGKKIETKTERLNCLNKGGKWVKGECQDDYITPAKIIKAHMEK